jgi:hypothetical protein
MSSISTGPDNSKSFVDHFFNWAAKLMPSSLKQKVVADDKAARAEENKAGRDELKDSLSQLRTDTFKLEDSIKQFNSEQQANIKQLCQALDNDDQQAIRFLEIKLEAGRSGIDKQFEMYELLTNKLTLHGTNVLAREIAERLAQVGRAIKRAHGGLDIAELSDDIKAGEQSGRSSDQAIDDILRGQMDEVRAQSRSGSHSNGTYTVKPETLEMVHQFRLKEAKAKQKEEDVNQLAATQRNSQTIGGMNQTALQILQGRK